MRKSRNKKEPKDVAVNWKKEQATEKRLFLRIGMHIDMNGGWPSFVRKMREHLPWIQPEYITLSAYGAIEAEHQTRPIIRFLSGGDPLVSEYLRGCSVDELRGAIRTLEAELKRRSDAASAWMLSLSENERFRLFQQAQLNAALDKASAQERQKELDD